MITDHWFSNAHTTLNDPARVWSTDPGDTPLTRRQAEARIEAAIMTRHTDAIASRPGRRPMSLASVSRELLKLGSWFGDGDLFTSAIVDRWIDAVSACVERPPTFASPAVASFARAALGIEDEIGDEDLHAVADARGHYGDVHRVICAIARATGHRDPDLK